MSTIDGKWTVSIKSPMGAMPSTLIVKSENGTVTGTQSGQGETNEITEGKFDGTNLTWVNMVTSPIQMRLEFAAVLTGEELSGKVKAGSFGSFSFTGSREAD